MRVTHITSGISAKLGGTATAVTELSRAQRSAGLDVTVISSFMGERDTSADVLREAGIDVIEIGPCRPPLQTHPAMKPTLADHIAAADVLHTHGLWEEIQHRAAALARELHKPYVITPHGMLTPWSLEQKPLKKKIYMMLRLRQDLDRAAAIHFTSAAERDASARLRLKAKILVEPLGLNLNDFDPLPEKETFRREYPTIGDRKVIVFLGRVHPGKGVEYLIPALRHMQTGNAVLVAVGPDSHGYMATMKQLAQASGVADRVLFTGLLRGRQKLEALVDADIFALPSEHENFGMAVLEALACRTPVVVSDGVAIHGEVADAGVGAVIPFADRNITRLAAELDRWLTDPHLRASAAAKARDFVAQRFAWDGIARRWVQHYAAMIGNSK